MFFTIQQQTNLALQDQIRRANDTQIEQTLAMHDLADMTEQRTYDSMFAAVPIYHGTSMMKTLMNGLIKLEALCKIESTGALTHHLKLSGADQVLLLKRCIRSIDPNLR